MVNTIKCDNTINLYPTLDPITNNVYADDKTVKTSNTTHSAKAIASVANHAQILLFVDTHAIADTRDTSFFVMEGMLMSNK